MTEHRTCTRCVMNTTVRTIRFDAEGVCNFCHMHDVMDRMYPLDAKAPTRLDALVQRIRQAGAGKPYDCVVGVSGGRDSTYLLLMAVKLGLRPLAVHFDNGWNSDIAVTNIQKAVTTLDVDLETVVADWEEFRDLLVAFLKASVPDADVPTDIAIHAVLHQVAAKEGISYILNGHAFRTEGIAPIDWTYMDGRYLRAIRKAFATVEQRNFPNFGVRELIEYSFIKRIRVVPLLNYLEYEHKSVQETISRELDWVYYGGHHAESYYTRFIQYHLLLKKFGFDRRRTALSAQIRAGHVTRTQALEILAETPDLVDPELIGYVTKKLGLDRQEFERLMNLPPKSFRDYPSYHPLMRLLRLPIWVACEIGLLPRLLYLKYLG